MLSSLPDEIWLIVFSNLSNIIICKVISKVCRRWYALSFDPQLWRKVIISRSDLKLTRQRFDGLMLHRDLSIPKCVSFLCQEITDDILKDLIDINPNICNLSLAPLRKLTNNGARYISKLSKLKHLRIEDCYIKDETIITIISSSPDIERLCVNDCYKLTNQFLYAICNLKNLSHLEIKNLIRISSDGLEYLSKNKNNLSHLAVSFRSSNLFSESLCLFKFSQLYSVEFSSLDIDSDYPLLCFTENNPSLRHMKLVDCYICGSFIYKSNLTNLEMIRCQNLSNEFYDYFKDNNSNKFLEELHITINELCDFGICFSNVKKLKVEFLEWFNVKFSVHITKYGLLSSENLVSLALQYDVIEIGQAPLEYILAKCKNLIRFSITQVSFSSSIGLDLVENLSIRYFSIQFMKNVDELLFEKLAKAIPNLCIADFSFNSELTVAMLKRFCRYCNHLQELTLFFCDIPHEKIKDLQMTIGGSSLIRY